MSHPNEYTRSCKYCGSTVNLADVWPDDENKSIVLCDDCAAHMRKEEAEADVLAALPSCDARQLIIDTTATVHALVLSLKAHDRECPVCTRKPITAAAPFVGKVAA